MLEFFDVLVTSRNSVI